MIFLYHMHLLNAIMSMFKLRVCTRVHACMYAYLSPCMHGILDLHGKPGLLCFSTVCPCRHKGLPETWQHLTPLLDYFRATHPQVSVLRIFSSVPCTQYNHRGNFLSVQNWTDEGSRLALGIFLRLVTAKEHGMTSEEP